VQVCIDFKRFHVLPISSINQVVGIAYNRNPATNPAGQVTSDAIKKSL
jgi:hypothetical protein